MSSNKRVVETTPQISVSSIKSLVSYRHPVAQLSLTDSRGNQMPYFVNTVRTKCYFGGSRPWFKCVLCAKRVGMLYLNETGTHLRCRECSNLRYISQVTGGSSRLLVRCFDAEERAGAVFDGMQRVKFFHKGQPTRRFKRLLVNKQKAEHLSRYFVG